MDSIDRAAHDCVAYALEGLARRLPALQDLPNDRELAAAKERIGTAGVLDATLLMSRGLSVAWSHVRTVIQTGAWDIAPIPPTDEDAE